jgi:hypothetical protein
VLGAVAALFSGLRYRHVIMMDDPEFCGRSNRDEDKLIAVVVTITGAV